MASFVNVNGAAQLVLPAQHPATLARRGKAPAPNVGTAGAVQQVYAPGFKAVVNVPAAAVRHMPAAALNVTRLVLCANYDAAKGDASCAMGARCKFVHADTRGATTHEIHVNYAWRSLAAVEYERFPAGSVLHVAAPNGKAATDVMDSHMALKTQALATKRRPLTHCAHYYYNRTCNLGAECQFVHAVFVDPDAKDHQRAPVPAQLGRHHGRSAARPQPRNHVQTTNGRQPVPDVPVPVPKSKQLREAAEIMLASAAPSEAVTPRAASMTSQPQHALASFGGSVTSFADAVRRTSSGAMLGSGAESPAAHVATVEVSSCGSDRTSTPPSPPPTPYGASLASSVNATPALPISPAARELHEIRAAPRPRRFRHNPYDASAIYAAPLEMAW